MKDHKHEWKKARPGWLCTHGSHGMRAVKAKLECDMLYGCSDGRCAGHAPRKGRKR